MTDANPKSLKSGNIFENWKIWAWLAAVSFVGGAIVLGCNPWGAKGWELLGAFGDFSQGTTLAFLTIAAFIYIKKTFDEQAKQVKILERQDFQSQFFTLFEAHQTLVENIKEGESYGPAAFKVWYEEMRTEYEKTDNLSGRNPDLDMFRHLASVYFYLYNRKQGYLGHYFRSLYNVFRFIADSVKNGSASEEQGRDYARLARAHISNYELPLLAMNAVMKEGKRFRQYIKDYELLRHVPESLWLAEGHKAEVEKILNGGPIPQLGISPERFWESGSLIIPRLVRRTVQRNGADATEAYLVVKNENKHDVTDIRVEFKSGDRPIVDNQGQQSSVLTKDKLAAGQSIERKIIAGTQWTPSAFDVDWYWTGAGETKKKSNRLELESEN